MTPQEIHRLASGIRDIASATQDLLLLAKKLSDAEPDNALTISSQLQVIAGANDRLSTFAMNQAQEIENKN